MSSNNVSADRREDKPVNYNRLKKLGNIRIQTLLPMIFGKSAFLTKIRNFVVFVVLLNFHRQESRG